MTDPDPHETPLTRRALRAARERAELPASALPRHARRGTPFGFFAGVVTAGMLVVGGSVAVTTAMETGEPSAPEPVAAPVAPRSIDASLESRPVSPPPPAFDALDPVPVETAVVAGTEFCADPAVTASLAAGDDAAVIAAAGGASAFRSAIAAGTAPCIDLADPARVWVVVDKLRPLDPIDYQPSPITLPAGVPSLAGGELRTDAAGALTALADAARVAGVGDLAVASAYRSYTTQTDSYRRQVDARGAEGADLVSARPGHSEHQTALAADIVPCAGACGTLDDVAASPQGQWVAAHAWEYGWIVRYEDGHTGVTGYAAEPWHLRYIGVDLAREYHAGGWATLEEFFGLPAAPDYPG